MLKTSVLGVWYFLVVCHIGQTPLTAFAQHSISVDTANVASAVLENMDRITAYENHWDTHKDVANVDESSHDATLVSTKRAFTPLKTQKNQHPSALQEPAVRLWGCGVAGCVSTRRAFSEDNVDGSSESARSISRMNKKHNAMSHNINMQNENAGDGIHVDNNGNDMEHSSSHRSQLRAKTQYRIAQRAEKLRFQNEDSDIPETSNLSANVESSDNQDRDSFIGKIPHVQLHAAAMRSRKDMNTKKRTSTPADASFENLYATDTSLRTPAFAQLHLERRQHDRGVKRLGNILVPFHHALPRTHVHFLIPGYASKADVFDNT